MAESENQLELKKRARRRLVGSVALALTAAVVLPMVMDHEPKPLTQDIQIRIPSQDSTNASRPVTSKPVARDSIGTKPIGQPDPPESAAATGPEAARESQKPVEPDGAKAETVSPAKPEVKPAPKPEAKVEQKSEVRSEVKQASQAERESKVEAILSGNESAPDGQFIVQLGAFGDPANVSKVRTRVKAAGYSSYTEVLKGPNGNQTRVRAGPFASREAAEQAAVKLKHAGLPGVVAPK